ncbi:4-hydroxy-3-methylbut-2-en-1-yl diphosphate synthase (flavodoxin) [Synergistales bacterium]|nr:4-hydroxy-3-methylbut-2-en-1-yl diphosphate synthase (flavodoxin) [Synergistales bacterium]
MSSLKSVTIGGLQFGGGAPIRVESMLKTRLGNVDSCLDQLSSLASAGCELVRVAFPDDKHKKELRALAERSPVSVMADIHFNYRFALAAIDCGCASIRINPGNMGSREGLMEVLAAAKANGTVIRIGSNGGSLSSKQTERAGGSRARALVIAVEEQLAPLIDAGFENLIISAKSSSVPETLTANHELARKYPFALHIGITEAGGGIDGAVKSAAGLGVLLNQGIGDTMRVSLTGPPLDEVKTAYSIQRALGLRQRGINFISCPECGRRRIEVAATAERVRALLPEGLPDGFTVAVMGCEVNGPKEAASADIGVAGTMNGFVLFKKGAPVVSGSFEDIERALREI